MRNILRKGPQTSGLWQTGSGVHSTEKVKNPCSEKVEGGSSAFFRKRKRLCFILSISS